MIRSRALVTSLVLLLGVYSGYALAADQNEWTFKGNRNDITLSTRTFPGSSIPEFKANTKIPATMATVLAVLLDTEACPQWIHQCARALLIDQPFANEQIIYQINQVPLAKDRDMIIHATLSFAEQGKFVTIQLNAIDDYCQKYEVDICDDINHSPFVRIEHLVGVYELSEIAPDLIDVTWQQYIDPAGRLPHWLIRGQIDDIAYNTLAGMKTQAAKPRYQDASLQINGGLLQVVTNH